MGRREKPLDPGAGVVQRFAYELRKLRDEAGTPTYRAMALGAGYSGPTLSAAAAGERLPTLPVVTAYVTACGGDPEEWERRWRAAVAEAADAHAAEEEGSPYPGLARFDTDDRDHFHGRDDLIAQLAAHTRRTRFGAIVGASGSGKSSLLRAGLIPALRASPDPGQRPAAIRVLTPGAHPARTHEALFTPHDAPGETLLVVDQFEEAFALCADTAERELFLDRLLTARDPASRLRVILAVRADFYGRCAEHALLAEALRDSTLLVGPMPAQRLREAVVRPAAARRLVVERALTARIVADVADEPGGLPLMAHALREVWRRRTGKTLTLAAYEAVGGVRGAVAHTAEELYARCTPAEAAATRALLLRLVTPGDGTEDTRRPADRAELGTDTTTARVLEHLVRARLLTVDGDTVDLAHEALLGAWPRLRGWVDADREHLRAHRRLGEAARNWAELNRDAGALYRGVRLTEARHAFAERGSGRGVGDAFAEQRGYAKARDALAERGSGTEVGDAFAEQRPYAKARDAFAEQRPYAKARDALAEQRPYTKARDAFAEQDLYHGELNRLERDFLTASVESYERGRRTAARTARRLRGLSAALAVLLCLALAAWTVAWRQSGVSARQRDQAEARRVAALADTLRASDPRTAMRLALAAWRTADLPETRTALRTAAAQSEQDVFTQPEEGGRALNAPALLSADGRVLTEVAHDRAVQWDVRTHRRIRSVQRPGLSDGVIDVSADGRLVASHDRREGFVIGDLTDGTTRRLGDGSWRDTDGAFGPSGRTFVMRRLLGGQVRIEVWDVRRQRLLLRYDHGDDDGPPPALSRDDRHLAWCTHDGRQLRVLDVVGQRPVDVRVPRSTERLLCQGDELTFTPDGRALASATSESVVTWDFSAGKARPLLPLEGGARAVVFDGRYALTLGNGSLALWRTDSPAPADGGPRAPLLTLAVNDAAIGAIRLDADAGVLRYREDTRTSVVHSLSLQGLLGGAWLRRPLSDAAFDASGRPVRTTATPSVTVRGAQPAAVDPTHRTALTAEGALVDLSTGRERTGVSGEDVLTTGAFSPDGRYLVAADLRGRLTLWDLRDRHRIAVLRGVGPGAHTPALAFSRDGALVAASASDGTVQVWETAFPQLPAARVPAGDGQVLAVGFASDGAELHIATPHLSDRVRPLAPRRAVATVCARADGGLTEAQWHRYLPSVPYRTTCGDA